MFDSTDIFSVRYMPLLVHDSAEKFYIDQDSPWDSRRGLRYTAIFNARAVNDTI